MVKLNCNWEEHELNSEIEGDFITIMNELAMCVAGVLVDMKDNDVIDVEDLNRISNTLANDIVEKFIILDKAEHSSNYM